MARVLTVMTLFAFLLFLKSAFADTTIIRIDIEEVDINDRIHALETYDGKKIVVSKIAGKGNNNSPFAQKASDILNLDTVRLRNGKILAKDDLEFAYIIRQTIKKLEKISKGETEGKHPATDGSTGTSGGK